MGLLGKIFEKKEEKQPTVAVPNHSMAQRVPQVVRQNDGDPPIPIDVQSISHTFLAFTYQDMGLLMKAEHAFADLYRNYQPKVWNSPLFKAKFVAVTGSAQSNGYPGIDDILITLEATGLKYPYSLVINDMLITLDGGKTQSKVLFGVAFRDDPTRLIMPLSGGLMPQ
jgi:hypothetical protein